MAKDTLGTVRLQLGEHLTQVRAAGPRLSPMDLYSKMNAIRAIAEANGLFALESLARRTAQVALLPGHKVAIQSCLEHAEEALESCSATDSRTILAALATRLH